MDPQLGTRVIFHQASRTPPIKDSNAERIGNQSLPFKPILIRCHFRQPSQHLQPSHLSLLPFHRCKQKRGYESPWEEKIVEEHNFGVWQDAERDEWRIADRMPIDSSNQAYYRGGVQKCGSNLLSFIQLVQNAKGDTISSLQRDRI